MSILQNSNAISAGGYDINNSLRFRGSASAYLSRTPSSAGNRKTWTWSAWIKLGTISVNMGTLFIAQGQTAIYLNDGTNSSFRVNGAAGSDLITSLMPRDPSAWYHLVVACDTTQATDTNRLKIYVNGVQQTAFQAGSTYPTLNGDKFVNSTAAHYIGRRVWNGDQQYDGYIAEQYLIDGSQKAASDFGETDTTTGVWKPKAYSGTYGTNGFYLKFSDIATTSGSNAGLGKDFSGNTNYWTTNNISVTSGTTYDAMTDSPTLTSATVANYAVLNTLDKTAGTVSNGNLTIVKGSTGAFANIRGTISVSSGKWYYETTLTSGINYSTLGILSPDVAFPSQIGDSAYGWDWYPAFAEKKNNGTGTSYGTTASAGDVIMCAFDVTNGKIWWGKNGTWFASGDPAAGTNAAFTNVTGTVAPAVAVSGTSTQLDVNFGQRPFSYTPPTGFNRLNTYNLPDSTIKKGNSYMDATLYTGNGSGQTIVNQALFKPDFVWVKSRSVSGNPVLVDSVRGANKVLYSPQTTAEETPTAGTAILSFNSNGFSLGGDISGTSFGSTNGNTFTYVGWQWQAGQGSTSSNTSGSITSTVSVNTTAGFSIVTYTGNGTNGATVGHGLGAKPKIVFYKRRNSTSDWLCLQDIEGSMKYGFLNTTAAFGSAGETAPTSSVLYLSAGSDSNANGGTYVAYCWAEIAGFSKFGSYVGNGSADGVFVYLGFRPKFIMIKNTTTAGYNWTILDTSRDTYNYSHYELYPNTSGAEVNASSSYTEDILSNGFKIRQTDATWNASGSTYIYAAFAENPFKNANAR